MGSEQSENGQPTEGDETPEDEISGDAVPEDAMSGDAVPAGDDSGEDASEKEVAGDRVPEAAPPGGDKRSLVMAVVAAVALIVGLVAGWAVGSAASSDDDDDDDGVAAGEDSSEGHGDHPDEMDGEAMDGDGDDNGLAQLLADHHYEAPSDDPLDSEERQLLTVQLEALNALIEDYPTLGDADADDWRRAGPFIPGLGTHYLPPETEYTMTIPTSLDDGKDEGQEIRPVLIFEGIEDDSPLAGFMLLALGDVELDFAGPYDTWHEHTHLCIVTGANGDIELPFVADQENVTEEMCTDRGGEFNELSTAMAHVWSVPGYDSELGLFSEVNPKITCSDGGYERMPYDEVLEDDRSTCLG